MRPAGKTGAHTVLLLDNRGVRSFRLGSFWLKSLCLLFMLLFASTGFGGYLAYSYREKYADLEERQHGMERRLAAMRRKLDAPPPSREGIQETGMDAVSGAGAAYSPADNAAMAVPSPPTENEALAPEVSLPETALRETLPVSGALHPAKITNMSLRASGDARIHISFHLNNQDRQKPLSGRISLAVLTSAGATAKITQVDRADLSFHIRRYKKVSATVTLPPDMAMADAAFVQISLDGDNMPPYSERFPFRNL